MDDSPPPELGGRAALELRWLGETPIVLQGQTRGQLRRLDMDLVELLRVSGNGRRCLRYMTVVLERMACTTRG